MTALQTRGLDSSERVLRIGERVMRGSQTGVGITEQMKKERRSEMKGEKRREEKRREEKRREEKRREEKN